MIRTLRRRLQCLEGRHEAVHQATVPPVPDSQRLLTLLERMLVLAPAFGPNDLHAYLDGPIAFLRDYVAASNLRPHVEHQCGCTLVCASGRPEIPGQEPVHPLVVILEAMDGLEAGLQGAAAIDHWRAASGRLHGT